MFIHQHGGKKNPPDFLLMRKTRSAVKQHNATGTSEVFGSKVGQPLKESEAQNRERNGGGEREREREST